MDAFSQIFIALFAVNAVYLIDASSFSHRLAAAFGASPNGSSPFQPGRAQELLKIILQSASPELRQNRSLLLQLWRVRAELAVSITLFAALMYVVFNTSQAAA